jgi:hypothetical protein
MIQPLSPHSDCLAKQFADVLPPEQREFDGRVMVGGSAGL